MRQMTEEEKFEQANNLQEYYRNVIPEVFDGLRDRIQNNTVQLEELDGEMYSLEVFQKVAALLADEQLTVTARVGSVRMFPDIKLYAHYAGAAALPYYLKEIDVCIGSFNSKEFPEFKVQTNKIITELMEMLEYHKRRYQRIADFDVYDFKYEWDSVQTHLQHLKEKLPPLLNFLIMEDL